MNTLPQSWPFPTKGGGDQRAAMRGEITSGLGTRQGTERAVTLASAQRKRRPPKPRTDAKLDVSTFDAPY